MDSEIFVYYTMIYHLTLRKNEIMSFEVKQMEL